MFSHFNLVSLNAFLSLLNSYGNPNSTTDNFDDYMQKSINLEKIEQLRSQPEFDRIYCLWVEQFAADKPADYESVFQREISNIKLSFKAAIKPRLFQPSFA